MTIAFIDGPEIRDGLAFPALIEALRAGHRAPPPAMERTLMAEPGSAGAADDNAYLAWHAWARGGVLAVKLVTLFPANPGRQPPVPAVQAVIALFDAADGRPLAVLDGTELTYWKTAADTALAGDLLARADARSLLIVGAGGLAPYHIKAYRAVRPGLDRVMVWNRTPRKAAAVAADPFIDGPAEAVGDLAAAAGEADIVCCLTGAGRPILHGAWLKPGGHVALVGGFTPAMREADDEVMRRGRIFVDSRWFTIAHCGDLIAPIAAGAIAETDIEADLFELCQNLHPGRRDDAEITVFKNAGGAHLDLMAAEHALAVLAAS